MPSYLVHFNRLHDKKGRFTYGDGDGDGRRDDRKIGEGDRSYDTPNSGRRNYEGGGGGRIGGGRTKNSATSKSEQTKNNEWTKREYGKTEFDYAPKNGKRIMGDPRAAESSQARSLAGQHSGTTKSVSRNAISKYGPVTPKTPGIGDGSGRSKGDWSGNSSGSNYAGTSRGASMAPPPSNSSTASSELSDEMTDMLKKDQTKDNIRKKYEEAVEKGKDFVDKVFGGKETSTNAKSSDKYRKSDNAGKHGYDKRK